jgi:peroxiredoxin Q/BCP
MMTTRKLLATVVALASMTGMTMAQNGIKVKEGDKFPNIPLQAAQIEKVKKDGDTLSIADLKGKTVVVFFYPKASTPGCTVESCGFRDLAKEFGDKVVLIGASADDMAAQNKFIKEHNLPFPLLCDTEAKLINELGIASSRGKIPQRITFLIDGEGVIRKIYTTVSPAKHPKEVLADSQKLAAK